MALAPAVTDLEQLKSHPAVSRLASWNAAAVEGAKFSIYLEYVLMGTLIYAAC